MYATKTTYQNSFKNGIPKKFEKPGGCRPVQVIALYRHGTRFPSLKNMKTVDRLLTEFVEDYPNNVTVRSMKEVFDREFHFSEDNELSRGGARELIDIGKRVATNFNQLFKNCKAGELLFKSSSTERAFDSCSYFQEGFSKVIPFEGSTTITDDFLLRFFDKCSNYITSIKKDKLALKECEDFQKNSYQEINRLMEKKLNFKVDLKRKEQLVMFSIAGCAYAFVGDTVWSTIFPEEARSMLEYSIDLKKYYDSGYGHEISSLQSCHLFSTFFRHIDSFIENRLKLKGVFYFAHAETLLPVMCLMGLFKDDEPLRHDNYERMRTRLFRTSFICSFAANIMIVLYDCNKIYKVQVLHNEKAIRLPPPLQPDDKLLYSYSDFKNHYKDVLNRKFNDVCRLEESKSSSSSFSEEMSFSTISGTPSKSQSFSRVSKETTGGSEQSSQSQHDSSSSRSVSLDETISNFSR
ncbi:hypothetical protein HELRODRAFT_161517 [Helobdella robusta]|uniref:Multiple inositol polyphosphate phosphatase 1 n=1 Tax=Helobdella robusta TaxID=6412 RepID=T1ERL0_HELRO|nr:hypothetical protein HELRODRAFT_161517 [Helobdella robusta]ESO02269.1 hypothetical protein HELRODRAFT_161517 [Helobdella robusta]